MIILILILILILHVTPAKADELSGTFENQVYVSPNRTFSCSWFDETLLIDVESLSDNYNEEQIELVRFSTSKANFYINYWFSVSPSNTHTSEKSIESATEKSLTSTFYRIETNVFKDVFLLKLTEIRQELVAVNSGIAALKIYLAEFNGNFQRVSAIAWVTDQYVVTSIVMPLDMSPTESETVLHPNKISALARAHFNSCKISTK